MKLIRIIIFLLSLIIIVTFAGACSPADGNEPPIDPPGTEDDGGEDNGNDGDVDLPPIDM